MMALRKQVVTKAHAFESKNLSSETALSAAVASVVAESVRPPIKHTYSEESPDFYMPPDDADDAADQAPPLMPTNPAMISCPTKNLTKRNYK